MGRISKSDVSIFVFFICLSIYLIFVSYYENARYVGDTALYGQVARNIAYTGVAEGNIFANTQDFIDRRIAALSVEERLSNQDTFTAPEDQKRNLLLYHAHYILYLIAPLCYFWTDFMAVTIVQAVTLALSLIFLILLMKEKKMPLPIIILTCFLLVSHPGWSRPAIYGAFYPERIFMGTGMYLVWSLDKEKINVKHFIIATILCCLVGERGALYAGMFTLAYTIFYWKRCTEYRILRIIIGGLSVTFSFFLMFFVLDNVYYSGMSDKINLLEYLSSENNREKIVLFILINVVLFLTIAISDWRAYIIALCSMIPNVLYDVGGAEKIGWTLHYHVFYFVILLWAVVRGVVAWCDIIKNRLEKKRIYYIVLGIVITAFAFTISIFSPYDTSISFSQDNIEGNIIFNGINSIKRNYVYNGKKVRMEYDRFVEEATRDCENISTIESGMVPLAHKNIFFYPLGLDKADAALLNYYEDENGIHFTGSVIYYASEQERENFESQVVVRMRELGFDVDNPQLYAPYGIAVIKKK